MRQGGGPQKDHDHQTVKTVNDAENDDTKKKHGLVGLVGLGTLVGYFGWVLMGDVSDGKMAGGVLRRRVQGGGVQGGGVKP